jgi:hypothetical protein
VEDATGFGSAAGKRLMVDSIVRMLPRQVTEQAGTLGFMLLVLSVCSQCRQGTERGGRGACVRHFG